MNIAYIYYATETKKKIKSTKTQTLLACEQCHNEQLSYDKLLAKHNRET